MNLDYLDTNSNSIYTSGRFVIWKVDTDESGAAQSMVLLARGFIHSADYPFVWCDWSRENGTSFRIETLDAHPEQPERPFRIEWDESGRMKR